MLVSAHPELVLNIKTLMDTDYLAHAKDDCSLMETCTGCGRMLSDRHNLC